MCSDGSGAWESELAISSLHDEIASVYDLAHDPELLLKRWLHLAKREGLTVHILSQDEGGFPVYALEKTGEGESFYLSSGVHGDEPAAVLGLLSWAEVHLSEFKERPLLVVPIWNPSGLGKNLRVDHRGDDLNRSFDKNLPLMLAWRRLLEGKKFSRAVCLHEDYEASGIYVYELKNGGIDRDILAEIEDVIPRDTHDLIDGNEFHNGVMTRGIEEVRAIVAGRRFGCPEAVWLFLHLCSHVLTFETPSEYDIVRRIEAHVRFMDRVFGCFSGSSSV